MFHSITINGKNTWTDYHMVPVNGIPLPATPSQKRTTIDLKTGNGVLDTSTLLTGYPLFQNRSGKYDFYILEPWEVAEYTNDSASFNSLSAHEMESQILNDLNGTKGRMIFEDDSDYYYEGNFAVTSFETETLRRRVEIQYDVKPYKIKTTAFTTTLNGSPVSGAWSYSGDLTETDLGYMPINPILTVTGTFNAETVQLMIMTPDESGSYANAKTQIKTLSSNITNYIWPDFLIYRKARLCFKGSSDKSVIWTFNQGRL